MKKFCEKKSNNNNKRPLAHALSLDFTVSPGKVACLLKHNYKYGVTLIMSTEGTTGCLGWLLEL